MGKIYPFHLDNSTSQPEVNLNANEFFSYGEKSISEEQIKANKLLETWLQIRLFGDVDAMRFEEMKRKTKTRVNLEIEYVDTFGGVQNSSVGLIHKIHIRESLLGKGTRLSLLIILFSLLFLVNNLLLGLAGLFFGFACIFAVNVASWIDTGDQYFSVYISVLGFFAMMVLTIMSVVGIFNY